MNTFKMPPCIDEFELRGKNVFIRVDFNVPTEAKVANYQIKDPSRILAALDTIRYAMNQGAHVILCSHFGRPAGGYDPVYSLKPVGEYLSELLEQEVFFSDSCTGMGIKKLLHESPPGSVMLLENIRFHKEEKKQDVHFYHQLAEYTDVYINDAFGTCHRNHASITGLPQLIKEKGMGFLVKKELIALSKLIFNPVRPFWTLLGGAKVSDKIQLIEKFIGLVDGICIGGAMAYPFLKAQGIKVGDSFCEDDRIEFASHLLKTAKKQKKQLLLPVDHVVGVQNPETRAWKQHTVIKSHTIPEGVAGIDIGPKTVEMFTQAISNAKQLFWNGPMGVYEDEQAKQGTVSLAKSIAAWKSKGYEAVIGGGDSAALIHELGIEDDFYYISTGGGAALTFLEQGSLPGIEVLTQPARNIRDIKF